MEANEAPKILVVDDNAENLSLAKATLEDEDFRVVLAKSGEEGVAAFERERPDCVLLDVRMPGMDGFAVCKRIRELPFGAETPIVFLTALRDVDTFDRALRAGGDDFLTKPVRPTELLVRVQAALKLRRMSGELRETYDLVRRQRDDLMRLQLQKERLTSFVVHDLKNPVNSMDLHAQLLLRDSSLSPAARESVQHIRAEARALLRLVLNLLDISKSEEGELRPRLAPVDLDALTAEVLDALELRARADEITFERSLEARTVQADADLLRRVLENLVENALRHAPPSSVVEIASRTRDGAVEITVRDAGPGVAPEMREKIFERFAQLEGGERVVNRAGRGLGLTFCKLAVEAHGGTITVEDAHPGALFRIRLPQPST
ncbi:MAG TPA: hybrid sensor histidine kinase/response regulator [Polyangiaceae bacterium]|nr:hybrid sensor histidine kinase/response regulator [Polyangiaceae bacterium]